MSLAAHGATPDLDTPLVMADQAAHVFVTDDAARKVADLIAEESEQDLKLRIYVMGGGCSGFQYGFAFESEMAEDDYLFERLMAGAQADGRCEAQEAAAFKPSGGACIALMIDSMSFQYLEGAQIDYVEDVQGARFVIRNPNAKTTCGCGSSFSA